MTKLYWEDFQVGDVREYGGHEVTEEEIIRFGKEFDPQPFHVDEDAAARSPFGGLVASGWQTAGFFMRMLVDNALKGAQSMGSPGVEWLRWRKPVRPGDTLHVRQVVVDKKPSRNHANMGHVKNHFEILNQDHEVVMEMESYGMFLRRPDGETEA
ncbi:MaoC family dehydratase [Ectothiorhodospiraceae bacterium WFHF3C12]|nr:MaoC family dehydratase [Ectothiorhodospiraceae bacterium WFHF3C12]